MELGFIKGREVQVLLNRRYLIVLINNAKFVLDKKLAELVEVD